MKNIKVWLGFPSRGVTNLSITHHKSLDVKLPSNLYLQAHMNSFISMTLGSKDELIKKNIVNQIKREEKWGSHQFSTVNWCQSVMDNLLTNGVIPPSLVNDISDVPVAVMDEISKYKAVIKVKEAAKRK